KSQGKSKRDDKKRGLTRRPGQATPTACGQTIGAHLHPMPAAEGDEHRVVFQPFTLHLHDGASEAEHRGEPVAKAFAEPLSSARRCASWAVSAVPLPSTRSVASRRPVCMSMRRTIVTASAR